VPLYTVTTQVGVLDNHAKADLAAQLTTLHCELSATGAPDDQIVLGIQEVPPSQAMEMGQIMPDGAEHKP
jgi:phenylpyruvate tautomerase PptA (4-oxalocrotonate tautomerase family)